MLDWIGLAVVVLILAAFARWFSRRTFRIAALLAVGACAVLVTRDGLNWHRVLPSSLDSAFDLGGVRLERAMLGPLLPGGHRVLPGLAGWIALLVLLGGILVYLDAVAARREQPRVRTPAAPNGPAAAGASEPGPAAPASDAGARPEVLAAIEDRLQFRLPAVEVRKPAVMPGGSTLGNLAAIVSDSGIQGSSIAAAVMRAVRSVEAQPRTYEARLLVEPCDPDGGLRVGGRWLRMTVDLRDARDERSIAVRMLPPCLPAEAAERIAGFTARQVFSRDPATPAWAVGSADGEDLTAYLLARLQNPRGRTFRERQESRRARVALLESAVRHSPNAGTVQYELAGLCDLDGHNLESLLLHLGNREHHPRFLTGRYRLATSLSMLSTPHAFERQWCDPGGDPEPRPYRELATVKSDILRVLCRRDMLSPEQEKALRSQPCHCGQETSGTADEAHLALLRLARRELAGYRRALRPHVLLGSALIHRSERASKLALLRAGPSWWRHPRMRRWASLFSLQIIERRIEQLEGHVAADHRLAKDQERAGKLIAGRRRPWGGQKTPWQAVYNAACLYAQPMSGDESPSEVVGRSAVDLLRLVISDPGCELDRPSEWMAMDPNLYALRDIAAFSDFVREQAALDFASAKNNNCQDRWFRVRLPGPDSTGPTRRPGSSNIPPGAVPRPRRSPEQPGEQAGKHAVGAARGNGRGWPPNG